MVVRLPEMKKYLNRDGLEEYNSLLPHSSTEIEEYVADWLDAHPEATTTVQDGSITTQKLADASVTRNKLAADVAHLLGGMMLTKELQGEMLTTDDAYSVAPLSMEINGKSTQDGTPTPENPVEIVSIEQVMLHASADGATDATDWPILLNLTHALRSLPSGIADILKLTYIKESANAGKAIYHVVLLNRVGYVDLGELTNYEARPNYNKWYIAVPYSRSNVNIIQRRCTHYTVIPSQGSSYRPANNTIGPRSVDGTVTVYVRDDRFPPATTSVADFKNGVKGIYYEYLMDRIITYDLGEIELPVLPAPNCTVWSNPTTGLKMSYMRDANIVISDIEQAIADQ